MQCEKHWPSGLSNDINLGLRPRFLSTESLGPCFSHSTGDHDQILHYIMAGHAIVVVKDIILLFYHGNAVILTLR